MGSCGERSALEGFFFFFFTYVNSHYYTFKDFGNIICSLTFSLVWMFSISRIVLRSSVAFAHSSEALVQPSPTPSCAQSLQAAIPEQPHARPWLPGKQVFLCAGLMESLSWLFPCMQSDRHWFHLIFLAKLEIPGLQEDVEADENRFKK